MTSIQCRLNVDASTLRRHCKRCKRHVPAGKLHTWIFGENKTTLKVKNVLPKEIFSLNDPFSESPWRVAPHPHPRLPLSLKCEGKQYFHVVISFQGASNFFNASWSVLPGFICPSDITSKIVCLFGVRLILNNHNNNKQTKKKKKKKKKPKKKPDVSSVIQFWFRRFVFKLIDKKHDLADAMQFLKENDFREQTMANKQTKTTQFLS